jgi:hypothetical protein
MRQILVIRNREAFEAEESRTRTLSVPSLTRGSLSELPIHASLLARERKGWLGRLVGGTAFVMLEGKAIGKLTLDAKDVKRGWIETR